MNERLVFCHSVFTENRWMMTVFQEAMNPVFLEVGLKPLEGCLLAELGQQDGQTINELSLKTSVRPTNMPPLRKGLEEKGLVVRRQDPNDSRAYRLYLTETGLQTLDTIEAALAERFGGDPQTIASLQARIRDGFAAFHELTDALRAHPPKGAPPHP